MADTYKLPTAEEIDKMSFDDALKLSESLKGVTTSLDAKIKNDAKSQMERIAKLAGISVKIGDEEEPKAVKTRQTFKVKIPEAILKSLPAKGKEGINAASLKPLVDALCEGNVSKGSIATALAKLFKEKKVLRPEDGKYTLK